MPVELIRAADHLRARSLGWLAAAWLEHFCVHGPGDIQGRPLSVAALDGIPLSDELTTLLVDSYALDEDGRRLYDSVFFSRPKGADKSGQAARIALFEAFGPCRFGGWALGGGWKGTAQFDAHYAQPSRTDVWAKLGRLDTSSASAPVFEAYERELAVPSP